MMALKEKTPKGGQAEGVFNTAKSKGILAYLTDAIKAKREQASIAIWRACYVLEDARQNHAALGHLWRQAGCCVVLSLFRFLGGRY